MTNARVNIERGSKKSKRGKKSTAQPRQQSTEDLAALAEDCERDMYGDDFDYLKTVGSLDR